MVGSLISSNHADENASKEDNGSRCLYAQDHDYISTGLTSAMLWVSPSWTSHGQKSSIARFCPPAGGSFPLYARVQQTIGELTINVQVPFFQPGNTLIMSVFVPGIYFRSRSKSDSLLCPSHSDGTISKNLVLMVFYQSRWPNSLSSDILFVECQGFSIRTIFVLEYMLCGWNLFHLTSHVPPFLTFIPSESCREAVNHLLLSNSFLTIPFCLCHVS